MKKKILSVALAAIFSLGISSFAQTAQTRDANCQKKECKKERCDKKDRKCDKKCDRKDGKQCANPFEGINLTEQQQQSIAVIPTPAQVMKAARDNNKVKADTANFSPEQRRMFARDVRSKYLQQVKAVLTPEQYVQFLENYYTNSAPNQKDIKKDGKRGDKKFGMSDRKGRKGDKDRKDRKDRRGDRSQATNRTDSMN